MKHFNLLLAAMVLSSSTACEKELVHLVDATKQTNASMVTTESSKPLRFDTIEDLENAILSEEIPLSVRSSSTGFTSFAQTEMAGEDYFDRDNAILSEAFGKVLNEDGKVIYGEVLLKVGSEGILYGPLDKEEEIDALARKDGLAELCEEDTCPYLPESEGMYSIAGSEGIYLYNTFNLISAAGKPKLDILIGGGAANPGPQTPSIPNPNLPRVFKWGHEETITGSNFDYDYVKPNGNQKNPFDIDKSIANDTKFYKQDYGVYSETGVKTKTMRKKGLIWNKFEAEVTSAVTDIRIRETGNAALAEKGTGWIDINNTHYKGKSFQIATIVVGDPRYVPSTNSKLLSDIADAARWFRERGVAVPPLDGVRYIVKTAPDIALTCIKDTIVTKTDEKNTLVFNLKTHQNTFYTDKGLMGRIEIRNAWYMVDMINFHGYSTYKNESRGSILRCRRL